MWRDMQRGFSRKLGMILAALVAASVLSFFGVAKAQDIPATDTHPDPGAAYSHAKAILDSIQDCSAFSGYSTYAPADKVVEKGTGVGGAGAYRGRFRCKEAGGSYYPSYFFDLKWHVYSANCPADKPWNETTHTCGNGCESGANVLEADSWVQGSYPSGDICMDDGCLYMPPTVDVVTETQVDGQTWFLAQGWHQSGQQCTAGNGVSTGTPPPDSDGDGVSNGNDGSPNNPGSTNGGLGTGSGNKPEDGSTSCGGAGQPACPTDGSGKGSGNGNTSGGGGDCATKPSGTGDAIAANILFQAWATRCAIEKVTKNGALKISGTGEGGSISITSGQGQGDGQGEGAFGGCTPQGSVTSFSCSGDSVGCIQAEQLAVLRCRAQAQDADGNGQPDWTQGDNPQIPGDGDGDYDEPAFRNLPMSTDMLDTSDMFGGGTCPMFSITFYGQTFTTADMPQWCDIVAVMRAVILIMAAYLSVRILLGGGS